MYSKGIFLHPTQNHFRYTSGGENSLITNKNQTEVDWKRYKVSFQESQSIDVLNSGRVTPKIVDPKKVGTGVGECDSVGVFRRGRVGSSGGPEEDPHQKYFSSPFRRRGTGKSYERKVRSSCRGRSRKCVRWTDTETLSLPLNISSFYLENTQSVKWILVGFSSTAPVEFESEE